jgi:hypothetical protein
MSIADRDNKPANPAPKPVPDSDGEADDTSSDATNRPKEIGGRDGPDPTRYGDWEKNGRCIDF